MKQYLTILTLLISLFIIAPATSHAHLLIPAPSRAVIGLLDTEHVHEVTSTDTGVTCHIILPYQQNLQETFFNTAYSDFLTEKELQQPRDLKNLHTKYTVGIAIISNTTPSSVYVVKDRYLHHDHTNCSHVITPRETLLANYPDLAPLERKHKKIGWRMIAPGIALATGGAVIGGTGLKLGHKDKSYSKGHKALIGGGLISTLLGTVLMITGVMHHRETLSPVRTLMGKLENLTASLQPRVVAEAISLDTSLEHVNTLLESSNAERIHDDVVQVASGEALIEPVILKQEDICRIGHLSLQHYIANPHLIHSIHESVV